MQRAAAVAQVAVRDDLDEVARRQAPQHAAAQHDQPAVLEHAHLAPVLGLDLRGRLLERQRLGVVDGTPAVLDHQVREGEVVAEARVDLDVVGAAHGVHGAVAAGDRAERGLLRAQPGLESPVDPLAVRAGCVGEHEAPAHVGDVGIGERAHELRERVGCPGRVGVGEGDDLPGRLAHRPVLRRDLPAARAADQAHTRLACREGGDELVGAVARRVRGDNDLEPVGGIVEREQVLQAPLDHGLLVVGGDDHRHRRGRLLRANGPAADVRRGGRGERIHGVRPGERRERDPEHDLDGDHVTPWSSRSTSV